jgi:general stress protein CsbA
VTRRETVALVVLVVTTVLIAYVFPGWVAFVVVMGMLAGWAVATEPSLWHGLDRVGSHRDGHRPGDVK